MWFKMPQKYSNISKWSKRVTNGTQKIRPMSPNVGPMSPKVDLISPEISPKNFNKNLCNT
jgi:hypothetical protein